MENNLPQTSVSSATNLPLVTEQTATPKKSSLPLIAGGLALLMLGLASGYYLGSQKSPSEIVETVETPSQSPVSDTIQDNDVALEALDESSGLKIYRNTNLGYELKYPNDWIALDVADVAGEGFATAESNMIQIQTPDLFRTGSVTIQPLIFLPSGENVETVSEETINGKTYTVYTYNIDNMVEKSYYTQLSNKMYLELSMFPLTEETESEFLEILGSLSVIE